MAHVLFTLVAVASASTPCTAGTCESPSACTTFNQFGYPIELTTDAFCVVDATALGEPCSDTIVVAGDTVEYLKSCAKVSQATCGVPSDFAGNEAAKCYVLVTPCTVAADETQCRAVNPNSTCKVFSTDGISSNGTSDAAGFCTVGAVAGETCSAPLRSAEDLATNYSGSCADGYACTVSPQFAANDQATCTLIPVSTTCTAAGNECAEITDSVCKFFDEHGVATNLDETNTSGYCAVAGTADGACTIDLTTAADLPTSFIAYCPDGYACEVADPFVENSPATCQLVTPTEFVPTTCTAAGNECAEITDSVCKFFDETGVATNLDETNTSGYCAVAGAADGACTIDLTTAADLPKSFIAYCPDGYACEVADPFVENSPATCQLVTPTEFVPTTCKFGGNECAEITDSVCKFFDENGVATNVDETNSDGYCAVSGSVGEPCTDTIEDTTTIAEHYVAYCPKYSACKLADGFAAPGKATCSEISYTPIACNVEQRCILPAECKQFDAEGIAITSDVGICVEPALKREFCTVPIAGANVPSDLSLYYTNFCSEDGIACQAGRQFQSKRMAECVHPDTNPIVTSPIACNKPDDTTCKAGTMCVTVNDDGTARLVTTKGVEGVCLPAARDGEQCSDIAGTYSAFCTTSDGCQIRYGADFKTCAGDDNGNSAMGLFAVGTISAIACLF